MTGNVNLGTLMTTLGVDMSQLGVAEVRLKALDATAGSTFNSASAGSANLTGQMLKLAAAATAVYESYRLISSAVSYGMRVETLGVAMNVVAKNAGLSADAVKYFAMQVKGAGVTSEESFAVITRAMTQGLDLNKMKELATRARDIAVVAGKNTSETFATLMHGIASGRSMIFHNLNLATRDQKAIYDEYAASLGKTADQLNMVERRMAMLNEVMRASASFAGAAAAADQTAGKQLASLDRVIKDTYESFWALFGPGVSKGIEQTTNAFKELQHWALVNNVALMQTGESIGQFVSGTAQAAISAGQWLLVNSELIKTLVELYIAYKAVVWIQGLVVAMQGAEAAAVLLRGAIAGLNIIIGSSLYTDYARSIMGAASSMRVMTEAGIALNAAMLPLLATLAPIVVALGVIGAYKTMTAPGKARSAGEAAVMSGVPGLEYVAGTTDKQAESAAKAQIQGPPAPSQGELQARLLRDNSKKWIDQATAAHLKALKESPASLEKGGAGKGQEAVDKSVRSFIETMNQAVAAGAGDTEAVLQAWKSKQLQTLAELAAKGADITQAKVALNEAVNAKQRKLDEDFNNWYIAGMGRQYAALQASENKKLKEVQGNAEKTAKVYEVFALKRKELDDQVNTNTMNLFKGYLDTMASLSPTLEGQVNLKRQSLELEIQLSRIALERQIRQEQINPALADQARSMEALVASAKRYNFELQNSKGLAAWATERARQAEGRNTISDFLTSIEQGGASAFSQGFYATLANDKSGLQQMAQNLAKSFMEKIVQSNWTMLWDRLAKAFKPADPMVAGAQQAGQIVVQAGQTFGQGVVESAYQFANIVGRAVPSSGGGGGSIGGLGGGGIPLPSSYVKGSSPGGVGGYGGGGGGAGGEDTFAAQFAGSISYFQQVTGDWKKTGNYWYGEVGSQNLAAGQAGQQSATLGMMSNMQLGLGAAGLGLGALGLLTGSQGLVTAGMVLQTAAVALQIAAMIMKATGFIPGAAHGAILGGTYTPIRSFAAGAPRVSAPTLAWVGEGPSEEAVIPLQQGNVPVKLMGSREQPPQLVYAPTVSVGDGVNRDDKEWFKRELRRQKNEVYDMLRKGNRNFVRMK